MTKSIRNQGKNKLKRERKKNSMTTGDVEQNEPKVQKVDEK
jgi:ribosome recycling factor